MKLDVSVSNEALILEVVDGIDWLKGHSGESACFSLRSILFDQDPCQSLSCARYGRRSLG